MISIQIPKDIREYETKFIGPFSFRQAVSIGAAALIELIGVSFLRRMGVSESFLPPLVFACIPLIFGFADKVFHMPFEKWLKDIFLRSVQYPKYRPYKTHNFLDIQIRKLEKEEEAEIERQQKGKTPRTKRPQNKDLPPELQAFS